MEANSLRSQLSLIAHLRSGTLPLNIETIRFGRFHKPQDRLCKFCNAVEDEDHFVFECKLFERHSFFSVLDINFLTSGWDLKWQMLMGKKLIYKFAKYVQDTFEQRQSLLG